MRIILAVLLLSGCVTSEPGSGDVEIRRAIIAQSISSYSGSCPCPYSVDELVVVAVAGALIPVLVERHLSFMTVTSPRRWWNLSRSGLNAEIVAIGDELLTRIRSRIFVVAIQHFCHPNIM